jgi:uncharacterized protein (TIGR02217 family)
MSDAVFPTLIGLAYPIEKIPTWNTKKQMSASGKYKRATYYSYPQYRFKLYFDYLGDSQAQSDDIHTLMGFLNSRSGGVDNFLFLDDTDSTVTSATFAVGDGSTTQFQLVRPYGGYIEPVFGIVTPPTVTVNGTPTTAVTVSSTGLTTFTTAPVSSAVCAWSGTFYYRVFMDIDIPDFQNIYNGFWDLTLAQIEFVTDKL